VPFWSTGNGCSSGAAPRLASDRVAYANRSVSETPIASEIFESVESFTSLSWWVSKSHTVCAVTPASSPSFCCDHPRALRSSRTLSPSVVIVSTRPLYST
jgi:hypothetical protein